ncbi:Putative membrane associated protein [Borrelia coriaceae ATCC 43381]|uniref:Membrane associated protein n=1 Tax=Borrelia coriaceae ATCC 43381 TaxID=1408429 RepID=W5T079_9SPIR|nr:Putative membrane associated protein [Borrelia coriaceae ATCC 43381]
MQNVYKDAPISNNQKIYDSILIILPFYSHDSMFKSFVNRLVKKGNIVYLYTPQYKHINTHNFIKNKNIGLLTYIANTIIKYLIEPIKIFSDRKDKTSDIAEIQNVIEFIKSTQKLKFLDLRTDLDQLILITMGNQTNIANEIISQNKQIKKYINIGGKPQSFKIKTLQLLIKQDENEWQKKNTDSSSIKVTNMNNIGEISDFIFSRRYLTSFNLFNDKESMLPRFDLIINEINKFIENKGP